jgi:hypothetical protein
MIDKDFLIDRYINKKLPLKEIAKQLGLRSTGYVCYCLEKHNIPRRRKSKLITNIELTKEFLEEQYIRLRKRPKAIAKEFGIEPHYLVINAIKSYALPIKSNK